MQELNISDEILDKALDMYLSGASIDDVKNQFPEFQAELADWLNIVKMIQDIPTVDAPAPTKQYRYAEKSSVWEQLVSFITIYRLAMVPLIIVMMFAGGLSLVSASEDSLPGDRLYSLKLMGEQTKLSLTFDQEKAANFHVELAQKRLDEAKRVIAFNDPEQEAQAINELTKQTQETFSAVSSMAATKAVTEKNSALLENLVAINKEQKSVLQTASESEDTKQVAENALSATEGTDKSLAQLIATVNEQALLDLPNKISVTGIMVSLLNSKLNIEKNLFTINEQTVITGTDGEIVTDTSTVKGKITVIGTREDNNLIAKKIVIIDPSLTLTTTKPIISKVQGATTTTTTPVPETEEYENLEPQKPSEATSGFIVEPNESQYSY